MDNDVDFADFVHTHTAALLKSAYLLTGNRLAAEELVQDTFVRLYPKWDRVIDAPVPIAYVRRSMMNNFLNGKRATRRETLVRDLPDHPGDTWVADPSGMVADRLLVRELLDELGPKPRAVLVMRFFHDLSDADIAADLGVREGTVRSIVSRALAGLRDRAPARAERS